MSIVSEITLSKNDGQHIWQYAGLWELNNGNKLGILINAIQHLFVHSSSAFSSVIFKEFNHHKQWNMYVLHQLNQLSLPFRTRPNYTLNYFNVAGIPHPRGFSNSSPYLYCFLKIRTTLKSRVPTRMKEHTWISKTGK